MAGRPAFVALKDEIVILQGVVAGDDRLEQHGVVRAALVDVRDEFLQLAAQRPAIDIGEVVDHAVAVMRRDAHVLRARAAVATGEADLPGIDRAAHIGAPKVKFYPVAGPDVLEADVPVIPIGAVETVSLPVLAQDLAIKTVAAVVFCDKFDGAEHKTLLFALFLYFTAFHVKVQVFITGLRRLAGLSDADGRTSRSVGTHAPGGSTAVCARRRCRVVVKPEQNGASSFVPSYKSRHQS